MARTKTTRFKNITRIDYAPKRIFGYNVRIAWKCQKYGKFFSDLVYGDRLAALDAAIEWRNATEKAIGKPRTEHQVVYRLTSMKRCCTVLLYNTSPGR